MSNETNSNASGTPSRESVRNLIQGVEALSFRHENSRVYGETNGTLADSFFEWLGDEADALTTPTEWYEAWQAYVDQYEDGDADDGEPYDIDDDSHYDPYTGGSDFMREHGEDCYGIEDF